MDLKKLTRYIQILRIEYDSNLKHFSFCFRFHYTFGNEFKNEYFYIYFSKDKDVEIFPEVTNTSEFFLKLYEENNISDINLILNKFLKKIVWREIYIRQICFYDFVLFQTINCIDEYNFTLYLKDYCFIKDNLISFDKNKRIKYLIDSKDHNKTLNFKIFEDLIDQYNYLYSFTYHKNFKIVNTRLINKKPEI